MRLNLLLAAAVLASTATAANADVKKGIAAWNKGEWSRAVHEWKGPAQSGDADAQFNMGQAYKLGRGVEYDAEKAREWYLKAANQGHEKAQDNYGLALYQDGRKADAIEWLEKSSARDEKRAQLVLGTLLYNGDSVTRDWPRAYALISRSAAQGMEQAVAARSKMDRYLTTEDRRKGADLARLDRVQWAVAMNARRAVKAAPVALAARTQATEVPSQGDDAADAPVALATNGSSGGPLSPGGAVRYARPYAAPAATTYTPRGYVSAGNWKVQLGAFRERRTAVSLWSRLGPVFEGGRPVFGEYGGLTRLQVAGFDTQGEATRACGQLQYRGVPCFVVRP